MAYWLEFGLSFIDNGNSPIRWRFPIAFQIIPLLVLFGICWFFPESPRWLAKAGRDEEARYILRRLRGSEGEDAVRAEAEFQDIKNIVIHERQTARSNTYFSMLFGIGSGKLHTGRRVQLVIWLQIMQEWVGIAGVTVYVCRAQETINVSPVLTMLSGPYDIPHRWLCQREKPVSPHRNRASLRTITDMGVASRWISGLNNIFYMFSTLICVFTLDRIGRRYTL